jgi:hypothetical protein
MDLLQAVREGVNGFSSKIICDGLEIADGTLRGWKSKGKLEGDLSCQVDGATVWNLAGLREICKLKNSDKANQILEAIALGASLTRNESVPALEHQQNAFGAVAEQVGARPEQAGTRLDQGIEEFCRVAGQMLAPGLKTEAIARRIEQHAAHAVAQPEQGEALGATVGNAGNLLAQRWGWESERMRSILQQAMEQTMGATA